MEKLSCRFASNGALKLDKSIDSKEVHPLNIPFIDVSFEVSKLDKSTDTIFSALGSSLS